MENWRQILKKPYFNKELFFYEKSHYLRNGISLTEILKLSENPQEAALSDQLLVGWSLSDAMATMNLFKIREIHLIRLAEETGDLAGAFERISQSLKEERLFREKIIGILIYPALLLAATVVFFIGALYYILPPLKEMLSTLEVDNMLLSSLYKFQLSIPMPVLSTALFILIYASVKVLQRKKVFRYLVFGKKWVEHEEMTFINELYLLLKGGVDLMEALHLLDEGGSSCVKLREGIQEGKSLTESLQQGEYSKLLVRYVQISEETGNLEESLQSYLLVRKTFFEEYLRRRTALLEPLSIFILGALLFLLSMAVMMPMMDAYEKL
ncbi:type II secretion system F family protein [Proteiniclasticum ruminis]|uniref:type II secretion system F family protein n=1 Tax=Proteiniclasticum ruminis TaxID=398199 RepID=UPI0028A1A4CF|nr:type II secretion system F family protein [Proteiniclasticum ruminis]